MKGLKKLTLASAIIAASSSAFAMQAMDDEAMSSATGQDGITINLSADLDNLTVKWIDRDGVTGYTNAGGVVITPIGIAINDQVINIDAGSSTSNQVLSIDMVTNGTTVIDLGGTTIGVGAAGSSGSAVSSVSNIITFNAGTTLTVGAGATTKILLGNRAGTYNAGTDTFTGDHLIDAHSNLAAGITLGAFTINDGVGGGQIGVGTLSIASVDAYTKVDVVPNGLRIDTTGTTLGEVALQNVKLGTFTNLTDRVGSLGDIYISGLTANNVITVTGH